jgi:hypothetical protein
VSKKKKTQKSKSETIVTKSFDIVRVDWKDHFSGNYSWGNIEDMDVTPKICTSVGVLVRDDDETVTLAQNLTESQRVADSTTILKSCIIKQAKLGVIQYGKTETT